MGIKNVKIENFTVFEKIEIDFANGINVIIGENGTGKTHLMKVMYVDLQIAKEQKIMLFSEYFTKNITANFMKRKEGKLSVNVNSSLGLQNTLRSNIEGKFEMGIDPNAIFSLEELGIRDEDYTEFIFPDCEIVSTFIPAKDMLTHSKSFMPLYNKFDMPFDKTYYDVISKSLLPNLKEIPQIGLSILPKLEKIIDGNVKVENDTFFIEKTDGRKIEFSVEAEGIKKIATLWQLIMNESITKDSVLFWDEPEANINPKLIRDVAEILLELSRNGVQIFVASHNYVFAKYIEVLMKDTDDVAFHSLYKTENDGVKCESNRNFRDLEHNSIISSLDKLLDEVFDLDMGD